MLTMHIKGMTCNHCVMAVTRAVKEVDPQAEVRIDLAQGKAEIDSRAPAQAIAAAIDDAGYEITAQSQD